MQPPFTISEEGERFLRKQFAHEPPPGMEPALHASSRMEVRDKQGKLTARYDRNHYFLGYSTPDRHVDFIYCDILGRKVAFHPKVIASLEGCCLTIGHTDPIEGIDHTHEILVAVSKKETARQT